MEKIVKLVFVDTANTKLSFAGDKIKYAEYNLNAASDVTSTVGSTATAGFDEWAAFYASCRVLRTKVACRFVNIDTVNLIVGIAFRPINGEAGWGTTWTNWRQLEGNYFNTCTAIGDQDSGNDIKRLSLSINLDKMWGDRAEYNGDKNFSSATSTVPASILQGYVYAMTSEDAVATAAGVIIEVTVTMWVRFYQKRKLNS